MKLSELRLWAEEQGFLDTGNPEELKRFEAFLEKKLMDIYQEMEMENRYVDSHQDITFEASTVNLHSHTFYEILYCRTTCGVEYLVGSDRYQLRKGDIIIIGPGVSHRPLLPEHMAGPYQRDVLWISPEYVKQMQAMFPDQPDPGVPRTTLIRTENTRWEFLGDLFQQGVILAQDHSPIAQMALMGNTMTLCYHLEQVVTGKETRKLKAEKPELIDQLMAYIEEGYAGRITLQETAKAFYISSSSISQLFRRKMGVSFYRCVTQRRLIAAKTLIAEGRPLESIAEQVGFGDYSAFYRAFKQEYGISPRQFKDNLLW